MSAHTIDYNVLTAANVVGYAPGMPQSYRFVAVVNHNYEKWVSEKFTTIGVVNYLHTQSDTCVWWNGCKSMADRIIISSIIHVHCPEERRMEVDGMPFVGLGGEVINTIDSKSELMVTHD